MHGPSAAKTNHYRGSGRQWKQCNRERLLHAQLYWRIEPLGEIFRTAYWSRRNKKFKMSWRYNLHLMCHSSLTLLCARSLVVGVNPGTVTPQRFMWTENNLFCCPWPGANSLTNIGSLFQVAWRCLSEEFYRLTRGVRKIRYWQRDGEDPTSRNPPLFFHVALVVVRVTKHNFVSYIQCTLYYHYSIWI